MKNKINIAAMENQHQATGRHQFAFSPDRNNAYLPKEEVLFDRINFDLHRRGRLKKEKNRAFFPAGEWVNRGENDGLDFFL